MLKTTNMKRISKELERDFNDFTYNCTVYHPNHRGMEIQLMVDNRVLLYTLTPEYPFKAPRFTVDGIHYVDRHKDLYLKNKTHLTKYYSHMQCPCCDTILCNWCPGNTLYQLLEEYVRREETYSFIKTILVYNIIHSQLPFDEGVTRCIRGYITVS